MNGLSCFSTYVCRSLAYNFSHVGICHISGATTAAEDKKRLDSELFASLDDDTELMFGDGVEDY